MQHHTVTLKLDPNAAQSTQLEAWARLHCELTNAALQERIDAWRKAGKSIRYDEQQSALPEIKSARALEARAPTAHGINRIHQESLHSADRPTRP